MSTICNSVADASPHGHSQANAEKIITAYDKYPPHLEITFSADFVLPDAASVYQELGIRFASLCQELGTELELDPAAIADAYGDPEVFDSNGGQLDMGLGLAEAEMPITFRFLKQRRKCHLMIGLAGSGKKTILNKLKMSVGRDVLQMVTETGFYLKRLELDDFASILSWDLPLSDESSWRQYTGDAVSLIFVVDSADADKMVLAQAELEKALLELDVPLLVYANKQDQSVAVSPTTLAAQLDLSTLCKGRRWFVQSGCAVTGDGVFQGINQLTRMLSTDAATDGGLTCSDSLVQEVRPPSKNSRIVELVLECIHNESIDIGSLALKNRTIAFPLDDEDAGKKGFQVGRVHQQFFFETMIPRQDHLLAISRTHFCLFVTRDTSSEAPVRLSLRHESKNPLVVDNTRIVRQHDEVYAGEGTWIGFRDAKEGESPFLVMRVQLRTQDEVDADGSLFSKADVVSVPRMNTLQAMATVSNLTSRAPPRKVEAVLECVYAAGIDVSSMPLAMRTIGVPLTAPVQIGRQCQPGFFENLLKKSPSSLPFLSRRHCELTLASAHSWWGFGALAYTLSIENLSSNVVFLDKLSLAKEEWSDLPEGGTLSFAAVAHGRTDQFLRFVFRRLNSNDALHFS